MDALITLIIFLVLLPPCLLTAVWFTDMIRVYLSDGRDVLDPFTWPEYQEIEDNNVEV